MTDMGKAEVILNKAGVGELLKSQWAADCCMEVAERVASSAGDGYTTRLHTSEQRAIVNVYAETEEAYQDNLDNNTLLKAIGG